MDEERKATFKGIVITAAILITIVGISFWMKYGIN